MMNPRVTHQLFRAGSIGAQARQHFALSSRWQVVKVYHTCFYCTDRIANIICIGSEKIDRGPFVINGVEIGPLLHHGVRPGAELRSDDASLWVDDGSHGVDLTQAETWDTTLKSVNGDCSALDRDLRYLAGLARDCSATDGFGTLIPVILSGQAMELSPKSDNVIATFLHKQVLEVVETIRAARIEGSLETRAAQLAKLLVPLVGRGFGLTPSGDDFCAGVVLGLAKMQQTRMAEKLALLLYVHANHRTTSISLAYFRALANTYLSEGHVELLESFGSNGRSDQEQVLAATCRYGATSGWDLLTGFVLGLEISRTLPGTSSSERVAEGVC